MTIHSVTVTRTTDATVPTFIFIPWQRNNIENPCFIFNPSIQFFREIEIPIQYYSRMPSVSDNSFMIRSQMKMLPGAKLV